MRDLVINGDFGGLSLSYEAVMKYAELTGIQLWAYVDNLGSGERPYAIHRYEPGEHFFVIHYTTKDVGDYPDSKELELVYWVDYDIPRDDPNLVKVVKLLGAAANGGCASLKIVSIPDDVEYIVEDYDGREHIAEVHRRWG